MADPDSLSGGKTGTILESIADGVFTVDREWRVTLFNRAAEEITGISRKEAVGRFCWEVFRTSVCEADCARQGLQPQGDRSGRGGALHRGQAGARP